MKGKLANMMSRARFTEGQFFVQYRDFKELIQLPVAEFWKIAAIIPEHRIARIIERKIIPSEVATIPVSFGIKDEVIYETTDPVLLTLPVIERCEVDYETLRFVETREALGQKAPWHRYTELEPVKRLKEEGRELLGEYIYIQEKRDGENLSIWFEEDGKTPHVSSHNMVNADPAIVSRFMATEEYGKAITLLYTELSQFNKHYILYGELVNKGKGPTRIEPTHKYSHWYLFDIFDIDNDTYLPYPLVHQLGYHYRIPVIDAFETFTPFSMEEIDNKIKAWKAWAKRHKREGVVGKVYKNGELIGFKEKIDLPDLPPVPRAIVEKATFPPMPDDRILRALQHSWDEAMDSMEKKLPPMTPEGQTREEWEKVVWKMKEVVMPIIAKHIGVEAREHNFNPPRNIYSIYLNADLAKVREHPNE